MSKLKKEKGITLVALIITIIVLLILAVVAIRAVQGDGILQYAKNSADKHQAGVENENTVLDSYLAKIEENTSGSDDDSGDKTLASGLYNEEGTLTYSWEELIEEGIIIVENGNLERDEYLKDLLIGKLVIDESITNILNLEACSLLTSVVIPNSVTTISDEAFVNCIELESIVIPDSIESIGTYAFENCTSLTSVAIPNSVITIEEGVFSECTSLVSVTIPNSITSIGEQAFSYCTSLTTVNYIGTAEEWSNITIESDNDSLTSLTPNYNYVIQ